MKTKEELNALKKEVEALNKKLAELTDEELVQVSGGVFDAAGEVLRDLSKRPLLEMEELYCPNCKTVLEHGQYLSQSGTLSRYCDVCKCGVVPLFRIVYE